LTWLGDDDRSIPGTSLKIYIPPQDLTGKPWVFKDFVKCLPQGKKIDTITILDLQTYLVGSIARVFEFRGFYRILPFVSLPP
jgi:hypothetical protein